MFIQLSLSLFTYFIRRTIFLEIFHNFRRLQFMREVLSFAYALTHSWLILNLWKIVCELGNFNTFVKTVSGLFVWTFVNMCKHLHMCTTYISTCVHATNENANYVIGIRSNNLLKSCCELLRILFGNYVYSSAHPVDVAAAADSVTWRRFVSLFLCICWWVVLSFFYPLSLPLFLFNFSKTQFLHRLPSSTWHFLFALFTEVNCVFSFDLISYFIFTSLSKYKFHFWGVLCVYVCIRMCWKIFSSHADCRALQMKYANVIMFVHRHNVLHMCVFVK